MKIGKEIIYQYCKEKSKIDAEHIENCQYNLQCFEKGNLNDLCGCPTSYGIEDFITDCEYENIGYSKEQCDKCWDRALNCIY